MSPFNLNCYFINTIGSYFLDINVSLPCSVIQAKDKPFKSHFMCIFLLSISVGEEFCRRLVNSSLGTSRGSMAGRTPRGRSAIPTVLIHLGEGSQRKDRRARPTQRRGRNTGKRTRLSDSTRNERTYGKATERERFLAKKEMKMTEQCPC